jgi:hypothetical protein
VISGGNSKLDGLNAYVTLNFHLYEKFGYTATAGKITQYGDPQQWHKKSLNERKSSLAIATKMHIG